MKKYRDLQNVIFVTRPGRVTHLTPFSHAESDVYLVTLGGAGLILHADEQALRLRASNAKRYTAVKDLNSPLPTVALCPSLEFASHIASKARCAKLTFTSRVLLTQFIDTLNIINLPRPSVVVDELTRLAPCCHRQHCPSAASLRLAPGRIRGQLSVRCCGWARLARAGGDLCERARFNHSRSCLQ